MKHLNIIVEGLTVELFVKHVPAPYLGHNVVILPINVNGRGSWTIFEKEIQNCISFTSWQENPNLLLHV